METSNLDNNIEIRLKEASNGWLVKGSSSRGEGLDYVFKSLKEVKNNLESIYSVLKQDPKQITEEDLDSEEKRLEEGKDE